MSAQGLETELASVFEKDWALGLRWALEIESDLQTAPGSEFLKEFRVRLRMGVEEL